MSEFSGTNLARPRIWYDRHLDQWCAWIPPTLPEHYDVPPGGEPTQDSAILGPWGDSYWWTWREAWDFIDGVLHA